MEEGAATIYEGIGTGEGAAGDGGGAGGVKKRRITVTMDPCLVLQARWVAKHYGLPLVALIERGLASVLQQYRPPKRLQRVRLKAGRKKTRRT